jgi:single-stranded DNA-specific DHH superfamily exonuclease
MDGIASQALAKILPNPSLEIDTQISLAQVNWDLFDDWKKFKPHGEGNPKPRFLAEKLTVHENSGSWSGWETSSLNGSPHDQTVRKTIGFGFGEWRQTLKTQVI